MKRWTTADFDQMSWHDVHVHGFRILEGAHGTAELILDIDYILEWMTDAGRFSFRIAPATLQFHEICNLRLSLDYATPSIGMVPFSLASIQRKPVSYPTGLTAFHWDLEINCPDGELAFESPGFTQTLRAEARVSHAQRLLPGERGDDHGA